MDYPGDRFEVIVVDDGSGNAPESIVDSWGHRLAVTLLVQANAGPAAARNSGAAHAKGDYLTFTDDDCMPAPNWLTLLAVRFTTAPKCAIGGRTLNTLHVNVYSTVSQMLIDYLYAYFNTETSQARFFASNNLAVPSDLFHFIGGFDQSYPRAAGEDRDFCDRWRHNGFGMIYADDALVYHAHLMTFRSLWRQQLNYGRGAFLSHQKRRARYGRNSMNFESKSFYWNLLKYPFIKRHGFQSLLFGALILISQLANTVGYLTEMTTQLLQSPSQNRYLNQKRG